MSPDDPTAAPERRCILSGEHGGRASLIRLALGPDGQVAPDLGAKAGGRGAWIAVDRATLEAAVSKGKLKGALARAFKGSVGAPDDLADRIAAGLERAALDRLGMENRAGDLILGGERILAAIDSGVAHLLLHAADAGADGLSDLGGRMRRARGDDAVITAPASREALSRALGRANVVHVAVGGAAAASRVRAAIARWAAFCGNVSGTRGGPAPVDASPSGDTQGLVNG